MISEKEKALWISEPVEQGGAEGDWVEYQPEISSVLAPVTKLDGTTSSSLICYDDELPNGSNLTIRQDGTVYQGIANVTSSSEVDVIVEENPISFSSYESTFGLQLNRVNNPYSFYFSSDGTKFYVGQIGNGDDIFQYDLSIPWDITTANHFTGRSVDLEVVMGGLDVSVDGIAFSSDGTKLFVASRKDYSTNSINFRVYQFTLTTPWTITSLVYDNVSITLIDHSVSIFNDATDVINDITFKSDGTKMYISGGSTSRYIYQYSLSTAWDISTTIYDNVSVNTYTINNISSIRAIRFNSDGDTMFLVDNNTTSVYQYSLSTAWDISTSSYGGIFFNVGTETTSPINLYFNDNYTTMYIASNVGGDGTIYQYSTGIKSETKTQNTIDITNFQLSAIPQYVFNGLPEMKVCLEDTALRCISRDTPMYLYGTATDQVQVVYSDVLDQIITAGDTVTVDAGDIEVTSVADSGLSGGMNQTQAFSFSGFATNYIWDGVISTDGTKMYVITDNGSEILQFTLSTPWDQTTATYDSISFFDSVRFPNTEPPKTMFFKSDGIKLYVGDETALFQYTMSTAWNVGTATYDGVSFDTSVTLPNGSFSTRGPIDLQFSSDGTKMYFLSSSSSVGGEIGEEYVFQYTLSTPWVISSATYDDVYFVGEYDSLYSMTFSADGSKIFTYGSSGGIKQYSLSTPWDVSTASGVEITFSLSGPQRKDLFFKPDGTVLYVFDHATYAYTTNAPFTIYNGPVWNINLPLGGTTPTFIHIKDRSTLIPYNRSLVSGNVYSYSASVSTTGALSHTFGSTNTLPDTARAIQLSVIGDKGTEVTNLTANLWKQS